MSAMNVAASSSWIGATGYKDGVMTLITKRGEAYAASIPKERYEQFLKAPSQGVFFNLYIKPYASVVGADVPAAVAAAVNDTPAPVKASLKKTPLPRERKYTSGSYAWLDFRCLSDPSVPRGLKAKLESFLVNEPTSWLPIGTKTSKGFTPLFGFDVVSCRTAYYVPAAYLLEAPSTGDFEVAADLGRRYRSAYRSWKKRRVMNEAMGTYEAIMSGNFRIWFKNGVGFFKVEK